MTKESINEDIKRNSNSLRGTIKEDLDDKVTSSINESNQQLVKFHGIYQQDDRDRRDIREHKKLEPDYSFMLRLRLPSGRLLASNWQSLQQICDLNANGTIKITTRQTIQLHGVIKGKLRPTIQDFAKYNLDSIATCGDVNRNVIAISSPATSRAYDEIFTYAQQISDSYLPRSHAYYDVWLDGQKLSHVTALDNQNEPLYKDTYLPRKFKIAIAIPPHNEGDVFANDIALIAITNKQQQLIGFNVAAGGGLGTTHGNDATYPRLASLIGYVPKKYVLDTVKAIISLQRDFGNRKDRKLARLKYTIEKLTLPLFLSELQNYLSNYSLQKPKPFLFSSRNDVFGWQQCHKKHWHCTLFVECGRVTDVPSYQLKSALLHISQNNLASFFHFTANQNIVVSTDSVHKKNQISQILTQFNTKPQQNQFSSVRTSALACVALNTCPLALAEAQRYLPSFVSEIENLLAKYNLSQENINVRITGCPNGCARPYLAEIALIGKSLGHYNLYLGGDHLGLRLNFLYQSNLNESQILSSLDDALSSFSLHRLHNETFGDFSLRYLKPLN